MSSRSKYRTRQRDILLNYFKSAPGVHITAGDVCEYFKTQGTAIGQSTIYRQLENLVDEGILNKYIFDASSPACFEYVSDENKNDKEICYHCKCEKCGKLIHLNCEEINEMQTHLFSEHQFKMNPTRTVFYGLCDKCLR